MNVLLRYILSRPRKNAVFDRAALRRILLVQVDNKIGDLVVATSLLRNLKQGCPAAEIDVLTRPACEGILHSNPAVSQVFVYTKQVGRTLGLISCLRQRRYDLTITLEEHDSSTTLLLVKLIGACHNLGFFKSHWPLFDLSLEHGAYDGHITDKYRSILVRLGLAADDMAYHFAPAEIAASLLSTSHVGPRIVLNCYGSTMDRMLPHDAAQALITALQTRIPNALVFLLDAPGQTTHTRQLAEASGVVALPAFASIAEAASHVCKAQLLISTDTAWLHIASAWQLPVLALYAEAHKLRTWAPHLTPSASLLAIGPASDRFDPVETAQLAFELINR